MNDVWVSSNGGSQWTQVIARAQWWKRWGHAVVITNAGAMVLAGSNNGSDVWASFNGGQRWYQCRLQVGQTVTENSPAVQLTADERLVVGSGYPRTDLWLSDQSLKDPSALSRLCTGSIPEEGVGLRMASWEPASGESSTGVPDPGTLPLPSSGSGALSPGVIVVIVLGVVAGVAIIYALWRHQQRTRSWNPFSSPAFDTDIKVEQGTAASHSALDSALLGGETNGNSLH